MATRQGIPPHPSGLKQCAMTDARPAPPLYKVGWGGGGGLESCMMHVRMPLLWG